MDKLEIFCPMLEKRNKYKIAKLTDLENADFIEGWNDKEFKKQPHVFTAKEESSCFCRVCLMNMREFDMEIKAEQPGKDPVAYQLHRPFKCTLNCCCFLLNPQEIQVNDDSGNNIGKVVQDWRCIDAMCGKTYWKVLNKDDNTEYIIQNNQCCNANMCAPTLCCPVREFGIYDAQEANVVGSLQNLFPGCNLRGCLATDSYKLSFPTDATPDQKALLLGGAFLIEYMLFEKSDNEDGM